MTGHNSSGIRYDRIDHNSLEIIRKFPMEEGRCGENYFGVELEFIQNGGLIGWNSFEIKQD